MTVSVQMHRVRRLAYHVNPQDGVVTLRVEISDEPFDPEMLLTFFPADKADLEPKPVTYREAVTGEAL